MTNRQIKYVLWRAMLREPGYPGAIGGPLWWPWLFDRYQGDVEAALRAGFAAVRSNHSWFCDRGFREFGPWQYYESPEARWQSYLGSARSLRVTFRALARAWVTFRNLDLSVD